MALNWSQLKKRSELELQREGNWLEMGFVLPEWGIHPCAERLFAPGNLRYFSDEGEAGELLVPPIICWETGNKTQPKSLRKLVTATKFGFIFSLFGLKPVKLFRSFSSALEFGVGRRWKTGSQQGEERALPKSPRLIVGLLCGV